MNRKPKIILIVLTFLLLIYFSPRIFMELLDLRHNVISGDNPLGCSNIPFALTTSGNSASCEINIRKKDSYAIELHHIFNDEDEKKKVWEVSGADKREKKPLSLLISIQDTGDNSLIEEQTVSSFTVYGIDSDNLFSFLTAFELDEGRYLVTIKNLKESPEYKDIQTSINFRMNDYIK